MFMPITVPAMLTRNERRFGRFRNSVSIVYLACWLKVFYCNFALQHIAYLL